MGVLASLLPGLRDLRAPLAAGYLWLLTLWLMVADSVPEESDATGVLVSIYRIGDVVSEFGIAVAVSFVAYLVGTISEAVTGIVRRQYLQYRFARQITDEIRRRRRARELPRPEPTPDDSYRHYLGSEVLSALDTYGVSPDRRKDVYLRTTQQRYRNTDRPALNVSPERAARDLQLVRPRLMVDHTVLYGEYDRFQSEADFRNALLPPLTVLILVVAWKDHIVWLVALLGLPLLWVQARELASQARATLAGAVISGRVESPFVENARSALERLPMAERSSLPPQEEK